MTINYPALLTLCSIIAGTLTVVLLTKSIISFTQTGPEIRHEIRKHYLPYTVFAMARLTLYTFLILLWMACLGSIPALALGQSESAPLPCLLVIICALASISVITTLQFCKHLLMIPSSIMMNSNYSMQWFTGLNRHLTISRLRWATLAVVLILAYSIYQVITRLYEADNNAEIVRFLVFCTVLLLPSLINLLPALTLTSSKRATRQSRPNLLMIGSDTLRADHIMVDHNQQPLTPFIESLARKGALFTRCITPIARTAPSLTSILTGTWPNTNGIKSNYTEDTKTTLSPKALGTVLAEQGYSTAAITDWAGSDLNKFSFGFQQYDGPKDQWNIKFYIRQGPKDLRLFLSLFTHNRLGKACLAELYYVAGKPLTKPLGKLARSRISTFARQDAPFFLNVFFSTTHPPFGSEYPYYRYFADPGYRGESLFGMSRLTDPADIIKSQREPKEAFDLDQVMDLYKGCVRNFDDELRKIIHHLEKCDLDKNTLIVIYSDHGMEFFENDTWGQGNSIYGQASNRIPLLIIDPAIKEATQSNQLIRTLDIMPTILEKLGIEIPPSVEGVSLQPTIKGQDQPDLPGFCETGVWLATPPGQHPDHLKYPELLETLDIPDKDKGTLAISPKYKQIIEDARDRMLELGEWRLVIIALEQGPKYELYHLPSDPECTCDVSAERQDVMLKLTTMAKNLFR